MAFTEDPNWFMADAGLPVSAGAVIGQGILDINSEIVLSGEVTIVKYMLTVITSIFGGLQYGDAITVNGATYKVEYEPQRIDDGVFSWIALLPVVVVPVIRLLRTASGLQLRTHLGSYIETQST